MIKGLCHTVKPLFLSFFLCVIDLDQNRKLTLLVYMSFVRYFFIRYMFWLDGLIIISLTPPRPARRDAQVRCR